MDPRIEKVLRKPPQYTRLKRHARTLLRHSTPRKLLNLFRVESNRKLRRVKNDAHPYIIIIDTGNICNLRCPLCPTGCREPMRRGVMEYGFFRKAVDMFAPWAYEVTLHNWGEPFLNNDILRMISYCGTKNLGTNLSSNLNHMPFPAEKLVRSGLEYLIVSLDGVSQDVYATYRVGGDLATVLSNLEAVVEAKRRLGSATPVVEWQFLVMRHNYHQAAEAERMAREIGVDLIRFIPVGLPFGRDDKEDLMRRWYPYMAEDGDLIDDRFLQTPIPGGCFYLYRSVTIAPDGRIAPCCAVWSDNDVFGDLRKGPFFPDIWNNERYVAARNLFASGGRAAGASVPGCCARCSIFEKP